jgi:hypothetical protein
MKMQSPPPTFVPRLEDRARQANYEIRHKNRDAELEPETDQDAEPKGNDCGIPEGLHEVNIEEIFTDM